MSSSVQATTQPTAQPTTQATANGRVRVLLTKEEANEFKTRGNSGCISPRFCPFNGRGSPTPEDDSRVAVTSSPPLPPKLTAEQQERANEAKEAANKQAPRSVEVKNHRKIESFVDPN